MMIWLVVWNMFFPYIGNVIIPTDELIFFRGVGIPPTSIAAKNMGVEATAMEVDGCITIVNRLVVKPIDFQP